MWAWEMTYQGECEKLSCYIARLECKPLAVSLYFHIGSTVVSSVNTSELQGISEPMQGLIMLGMKTTRVRDKDVCINKLLPQ